VVKNLPAEVPWYKGSERAHGNVAKEVQLADFLGDNAQLLAGVENLYLSAKEASLRTQGLEVNIN
jgi:hypothetical protein